MFEMLFFGRTFLGRPTNQSQGHETFVESNSGKMMFCAQASNMSPNSYSIASTHCNHRSCGQVAHVQCACRENPIKLTCTECIHSQNTDFLAHAWRLEEACVGSIHIPPYSIKQALQANNTCRSNAAPPKQFVRQFLLPCDGVFSLVLS